MGKKDSLVSDTMMAKKIRVKPQYMAAVGRSVPKRTEKRTPKGASRLSSTAALALRFQNIGQAHTPPAAAAVLLSLEAPFGVLFSVLFGSERPTVAMYTGFAVIFFAIILSETKLSFLPFGKKVEKGS